MYSVSVSRSFVAQHYLTVPNPGPEGELHSHQFTAEVTFEGPELGEYGYLVDIDAVVEALETVVETVRDRTLNDLPAFERKNPSAERLAKVVGDRLLEELEPETATRLAVTVQEDDIASVTHDRSL
ncbi:6-pyruvoyl trahydropterin synthase family protein [Natronobacterium gregoryi]|uniref:6-carboxytetrahydropterin synthase n=2 Tax=Natronobacterium gregoryi TaxID=44930 RepID=L0ALT6_NATGS|nr:6-carboxytetrahydropterin synthase [Natronobacterium gregoryi]AFZ74424.1 6-pyruvoyl-tetrahydropterin synthase [Natronobacterium gregoryi SP2]ELY72116.1 6-pyruvoyl-tetrahydropterin synthase [Natronobacterium gregoryi SP2]PLK19753.1 6-carboxytetrahydropterin synthase [Natronobacterium gregoryi SP2]SFJ40730.1 6-pyruvoyltetrahydropterin/6-carboxytetrahydropterin synthase [Natronobacterium gregoryi]